jgi:L-cysteine:1D-myo-inositol 2-amino-2-deoxy-alpha-D-glucopyranoside ligase
MARRRELLSNSHMLTLFNTLSNKIEPFTAGDEVTLYVCGVTPYDTTHLGHARTNVVFDVLVRHLHHLKHKVFYVQNVTDVDESILKRAAELDVPYDELGRQYTNIYFNDLGELGMLPAHNYPRATEAIEDMKGLIGRLLESGNAYRVDGDVYFRISSKATYGELSRLSREDMLEVERGQDATTIDDPRKEDPLDFPLWKAAGPGEPSWDSHWGHGRPGWHIECSTLVLKNLGRQIDIHGGGVDLIYPHHENEIAQSETATGVRPFARFWMHVAMVQLNGEKMSKSEGNMVFVRDLLARHSPDSLRLYLLGTRYRQPLDFDEQKLAACGDVAETLAAAARTPPRWSGDDEIDAEGSRRRFLQAMDDDLDTPTAIEAMCGLAHRLLGAPRESATYNARATLRLLASHLGLSLEAARPRS